MLGLEMENEMANSSREPSPNDQRQGGMVEAVARRLCRKVGLDPDVAMPGPCQQWEWFIDHARAAIEAMEPFIRARMNAPSYPEGDDMSEARQESVDAFYHAAGPCCAGCDWWRYLNAMAGECTLSQPISGGERFAMIGVQGSSLHPGAGHAITPRGHLCGRFKDDFDWRALPLDYQRRIGYRSSTKAPRR